MANASVRGSRLGLALGLFALGSLLVGLDRSALAKDPPEKGEKAEKPAEPKKTTPATGAAATYDQVREINEQIRAKWKENNLNPSDRCSDYEFIRRVSLDIIGRIAKPEEISKFLADPAATRRQMLIDRLLASEEYAKNWATIWTIWLMTRSGTPAYHEQMHLWLEEQFSKKNFGFDKIVFELLTATGENTDNGAVNYILSHLGESVPGDKVGEEGQFEFAPITSRTTRLFLGLQTQCTQCHDHPFNPQWKQNHFWGINAFFRQVERKGAPAMNNRMGTSPKLTLVDNPKWNQDGVVYFEQRKGTVLMTKPVFVDGTKVDVKSTSVPRRQKLVEFITASEYFPKAYVNRIWGHFFGRGMNNPGAVDDFGEHNPLTHPELLDYLAKEFKQYNHDPRKLITWICNSEAYQLRSVANKTNEKSDAEPFFSRMLLKSMSPEQLFESLMVATQAEAAETKDAKKKLRDNWMKNLIVNFGDDEGNEVTYNGTVVQALMLMNGKEINEAISHKDKGTVARAVRKRDKAMILNDLFLASLNRLPTGAEQYGIGRRLGMKVADKDHAGPYQDVFWALLNSNEFILNH